MIKFGGVSSDDIHVVVEYYPPLNRPERKMERISVPGRNGDYIIMQDAWEDYEQKYEVYLSADEGGRSTAAVAEDVAEWLYKDGWQELEDSYGGDTFRLAYFAGPLDISNILGRFGRATINFRCRPERFLRSGNEWTTLAFEETWVTEETTVENAAIVRNPTRFPSRPIIEVRMTVGGSGNGKVILESGTESRMEIEISGADTSTIYTSVITIDAETMEARTLTAPANEKVKMEAQPRIVGGQSAITKEGDIASVRIKPRWWTL